MTYTGVSVGFDFTAYSVTEGMNSNVTLRVVMNESADTSVTVIVMTEPGTAKGLGK